MRVGARSASILELSIRPLLLTYIIIWSTIFPPSDPFPPFISYPNMKADDPSNVGKPFAHRLKRYVRVSADEARSQECETSPNPSSTAYVHYRME